MKAKVYALFITIFLRISFEVYYCRTGDELLQDIYGDERFNHVQNYFTLGLMGLTSHCLAILVIYIKSRQ